MYRSESKERPCKYYVNDSMLNLVEIRQEVCLYCGDLKIIRELMLLLSFLLYFLLFIFKCDS